MRREQCLRTLWNHSSVCRERSLPVWWRGVFLLCLGVISSLPAPTSASGDAGSTVERYALTVPNQPELTASVERTRLGLTITDSQGKRFQYVRQGDLDTADGSHLGYYCAEAGVAIRWPVAGNGAMHLSDRRGERWVTSQQRVSPEQRQGAPIGPMIQPGPRRPNGNEPHGELLPGDAPNGNPPAPPRHAGRSAGAASIAWTTDHRGHLRAAQITSEGRLRLFQQQTDPQGENRHWMSQADIRVPGLVPQGPLVTMPDVVPGKLRFYSVDRRGAMIEFNETAAVRPVAAELEFVPGSYLALDTSNRSPYAYSVDRQGRLWSLDLYNGTHTLIDRTPGRFPAGAPISLALPAAGHGRPATRLLHVTDRQGAIWRFQQSRELWDRGDVIADGFLPGGNIGFSTITLPGDAQTQLLAAVDWQGRLQLLQSRGLDWRAETIPGVRLPPGAPVLLTTDRFGIHLCGVAMDGSWLRWGQGERGVWTPEVIALGFPPGAFIGWDAASATLFALDALGRIVPAHFHEHGWHCHLCQSGTPYAPQLLSRRIVPNAPPPPARVILSNTTREDLALQIADEVNGTDSEELTLPAGSSIERSFQRDGGGTLEETYLVGSPLTGWVEQVERIPLPPQQRYSVVVWAKRVTYQYIDKRKNRPQGAPPNFDLKSHVSIGAFSLPPGEALRDGAVLDVDAIAKSQLNPGAAVHYGTPQTPP